MRAPFPASVTLPWGHGADGWSVSGGAEHERWPYHDVGRDWALVPLLPAVVPWKIAGISAGASATRTDRFALPCGKPALHLIDGRIAGKGVATNKPGEERDGAVCWIDIRFRRSFMPVHPLAGLCMNPCWKFLVASTPDGLHLHPGD
ncbi:hypothetical protein [Phyllobacterium ifriqiyense]|uniref:hypothetical protein n=1 Tax=Phyllobacterium ifriqiyense TaxID=314238 RepID=UPI0033995753